MPVITIDDLKVPFKMIRSKRSKRIRIEWDGGQVKLVVPQKSTNQDALKFLFSQSSWITHHAKKSKRISSELVSAWPTAFDHHCKIPYFGTSLTLRIGEAKAPSIERRRKELWVCGVAQQQREEAIIAWMKQQASRLALRWGRRVGHQMGLFPRTIKIKSQKSQWGSCGIHNDIHLNWRLMCMPYPVFRYVLVHEFCHLKYRNHGKRFWGLVEKLQSDFRDQERWLRTFPALMFRKG